MNSQAYSYDTQSHDDERAAATTLLEIKSKCGIPVQTKVVRACNVNIEVYAHAILRNNPDVGSYVVLPLMRKEPFQFGLAKMLGTSRNGSYILQWLESDAPEGPYKLGWVSDETGLSYFQNDPHSNTDTPCTTENDGIVFTQTDIVFTLTQGLNACGFLLPDGLNDIYRFRRIFKHSKRKRKRS